MNPTSPSHNEGQHKVEALSLLDRWRHWTRTCFVMVLATGFLAQPTCGQVAKRMILDHLDHPMGIAIQPITGHLFVSETGQGRVGRVVDNRLVEVVNGFSQSDPNCQVENGQGPLGLVFLDASALFVGEGGEKDNGDRLRMFELDDHVKTIPSAADSAAGGHFREDESRSQANRDGDLYAVTNAPIGIYVTSNNGLGKWSVENGKLRRFLAWGGLQHDEQLANSMSRALTISPEGFVVVGMNSETTSWLVFMDGATGIIKCKFPLELKEIRGLAYCVETGELFALEYSQQGPGAGLYRLNAKDFNTRCECELVIGLPRPTAMCFGPRGELYVTVVGLESAESELPVGQLLEITGFCDPPTTSEVQ